MVQLSCSHFLKIAKFLWNNDAKYLLWEIWVEKNTKIFEVKNRSFSDYESH